MRAPTAAVTLLASVYKWPAHTCLERPTGDPWASYRLADVVKGECQKLDALPKVAQFYQRHWPTSIAAEYMRRTNRTDDYDTLCKHRHINRHA